MGLAAGYYAWLAGGFFTTAGFALLGDLARPSIRFGDARHRAVGLLVPDFNLALGSLMASAVLFFVPLALLAMVGPFFVRVLMAVADVGGNVGHFTACTLSKPAGTVLMGYVLIPLLPNSIILYLTSIVLIGVTAGYFLGWGRRQFPANVRCECVDAGCGCWWNRGGKRPADHDQRMEGG